MFFLRSVQKSVIILQGKKFSDAHWTDVIGRSVCGRVCVRVEHGVCDLDLIMPLYRLSLLYLSRLPSIWPPFTLKLTLFFIPSLISFFPSAHRLCDCTVFQSACDEDHFDPHLPQVLFCPFQLDFFCCCCPTFHQANSNDFHLWREKAIQTNMVQWKNVVWWIHFVYLLNLKAVWHNRGKSPARKCVRITHSLYFVGKRIKIQIYISFSNIFFRMLPLFSCNQFNQSD